MTKRTGIKLSLILSILAIFVSSHFAREWWSKRRADQLLAMPSGDRAEVRRIIAMSPSTVEMLYELGLGQKVVAVSRYTTQPPAALNLPKVGALTDVNYEQLVLLNPDCVVLLDSQSNSQKKLTELGINTVTVVNDSVVGILNSFEKIASVCGNMDRAIEIKARLQNHIQRVREQSKDALPLRVLVCIYSSDESESITIMGNDGYHRDLVGIAGATNAYEGSIPFPKLSRENLINIDPDVIIQLVSSKVAKQHTARELHDQWKVYGELRAVQEENIIIAAGSQHFLPGPRFTETLDVFSEGLNRIRQKP